ncbi:MAG: glycine zipper domain-containing protein [Rariglobus sp.]
MKNPLIKTLPITLFLSSCAAFTFTGCQSKNEQRGTAVGAAGGALIGGIIGHQSGETGAGAAIGAAAGGVAGNVYGRHQDKKESSTRPIGGDSYGYTSADYLALLTPDERESLRQRSYGKQNSDLADFLTAQEKTNLRNRASSRNEIGR